MSTTPTPSEWWFQLLRGMWRGAGAGAAAGLAFGAAYFFEPYGVFVLFYTPFIGVYFGVPMGLTIAAVMLAAQREDTGGVRRRMLAGLAAAVLLPLIAVLVMNYTGLGVSRAVVQPSFRVVEFCSLAASSIWVAVGLSARRGSPVVGRRAWQCFTAALLVAVPFLMGCSYVYLLSLDSPY